MRDDAKTIEILRSCSNYSGCENCPIGGAEFSFADCRNVFRDAADAIEELLAKDTNVPNKWISVEERLPETWKNVLTYGRSGIAIDCQALAGGWVYGNHVTHWMPLPEPPKEEN